jgi:hypothetical protein
MLQNTAVSEMKRVFAAGDSNLFPVVVLQIQIASHIMAVSPSIADSCAHIRTSLQILIAFMEILAYNIAILLPKSKDNKAYG